MANLKISQLTDGSPAASGDQIPINRAGANFRVNAQTVINANGTPTGTGAVVLASAPTVANPTFTGTTTAAALTMTGIFSNSQNGAVSASSIYIAGTPFTGGTGTTTFPLIYFDSGVSKPTTFSTAGTILGANAPSGFTGNFLDFHVNGAASAFSINSSGQLTVGGNIFAGINNVIGWSNRSRLFSPADANITITNGAQTDFGRLQFGGTTSSFPALKRSATVLQFDLADDSALTYFNWGGQSRVTTQFDKTSDVTLANIPGLSVTVVAGRTYSFVASLHVNDSGAGTGGAQVAIGGTATATSIIYQGQAVNSTNGAIIASTAGRGTALGAGFDNRGVTTATAQYITINGLITVNAAGTLTVQFAQGSSSATPSSVLVGSTFTVYDTP